MFSIPERRSLYTSIQNSEGIKAVKTSLQNFPRGTVPTKIITTFLSLILTLNNLVSNCKNYLQMKKCAMGTICPPAYAKIFGDHFERQYVSQFFEGLSLSYLRFVDDIFFIWTGHKDQLITFLYDLHTNHNSVKFGYKELQSNIPFPDTKVYIKSNKLDTKIYRKRIKRQIFLHVISEHPILLKNSML